MKNVDEAYYNITGVDIVKQRALWDERGKGYYGEYLVFREIYPNLQGCCKMLMNLEIPTPNGRTTEIDLLLIHETGLYVFEVKHYKGTIYGKETDPKWTQYFRTAANNTFRNPILQNQYHIKALRSRFPGIPIHSFVVFTSAECDLRVACMDQTVTVCTLNTLWRYLRELDIREKIFDIDRIDTLFKELLAFSHALEQKVEVDDKEIPLYCYLEMMKNDHHDFKRNLEITYHAKTQSEKKKSRSAIIIAVIACVISILASIFICINYQTFAEMQVAEAKQEIDKFSQKFEHVEKYNNGEIELTDDFVTASNVQITESADLENTANLQFTLNWNGEKYGASISRESKIIVILEDGMVKEYDLREEVFPYTSTDLNLGKDNPWYIAYKKCEIPAHELYGIDIDKISYIKISGVDIWTQADGGYDRVVVDTGYEIEIYRE